MITDASDLLRTVLIVVFGLNAAVLTTLIAVKSAHRRRTQGHEERRRAYMKLLSHHLTFEYCTDPIYDDMARDPAFLDAIIDVRNAVAGPETRPLHSILSRFGITSRLEAHLRAPFPVGRRLRSAVALAEMGDESSVGVLMDHLDDEEPEIRIQAARGLGRMRWTPAIDAIVARLGRETPWVRARFADTLLAFGHRATWPLVAYVKVNHHFETAGPATAIRTLATIGDMQAVEPLLEVLDEADEPEILIAVIETLGKLGSPGSTASIQTQAYAHDWRIKAKAAKALGEIGDPSSLPLLARGLASPDWWVRRNSAAALARIPGGDDVLYGAMEGDDAYAGEAAAEALIDRGDLAAARGREGDGSATDRDTLLMDYMHDAEGVPA